MAEIKILNKNLRGFTLIEVVIAVLILSAALVTLLGLQSSILHRALRDEEKQHAMLLARTILSAIEVKNKDIDIQDNVMSVGELMNKLDISTALGTSSEQSNKFDFMAHLKVENVSVRDLGDNLMKSVSLRIFSKDAQNSGEVPLDTFEIVYLIPIDEY